VTVSTRLISYRGPGTDYQNVWNLLRVKVKESSPCAHHVEVYGRNRDITPITHSLGSDGGEWLASGGNRATIFRSSNPHSCQYGAHPRVKAMRRDRIAVVVDVFRIVTSVNFSFLI